MAQSQSNPDTRKDVLQPPCPECGLPMWMVGLSTFKDDHDLRTFRCQVCEHTESQTAKFT